MGKLSTKNLKKMLNCIKKDRRVIIPPASGYDSGVHLMGDKYIVVSTDPCLGVPQKWFGWLMIHYPSSDVSLFGAKPEFCSINLLGPPSTQPQIFLDIMKQACEAADELDLAIVTGHTGTYNGLKTLIGVCTVYGKVDKDRLITPGRAKPSDHILCTKPIGLEIAVNLALTQKTLANKLFGTRRTKELSQFVQMQSCVKEALILAEINGVHAMHDATEGGLMVALNEMAEASNVGFKINFDKIPIIEEAYILQEAFALSDEEILAMSSTGTIVASISPKARKTVEQTMRKISPHSSFLGSFTKDKQRILLNNGDKNLFPKKVNDPYVRILSGKYKPFTQG